MASRRHAFTRTELMVVLAVMALLVSMLPPALTAARIPARRMIALADMMTTGAAFHTYAPDYNGLTPPAHLHVGWWYPYFGQIVIAPLSNANGFMWRDCMFMEASNSIFFEGQDIHRDPKWWGLGCLYSTGIVENHKIFYPPARTSVAGTDWDVMRFTDPDTGRWTWEINPTTGYPYPKGHYAAHGHTPLNYFRPSLPAVPGEGQTARRIDQFSNYPFVFDFLESWNNIAWQGANGEPMGLNVLYGDGHAVFRTDRKLFDLDYMATIPGMVNDPWGITTWESPGENTDKFLCLYLLLCDMAPNSIPAGDYMVTDEQLAHFWQ
jgi:prepilin-type processing-associated H-X9-DG protein